MKKIAVFKFYLAESQLIYVYVGIVKTDSVRDFICLFIYFFVYLPTYLSDFWRKIGSAVENTGKELTRVTKSMQKGAREAAMAGPAHHA